MKKRSSGMMRSWLRTRVPNSYLIPLVLALTLARISSHLYTGDADHRAMGGAGLLLEYQ